MDPFLISLAVAVATGVSTVAGKLIEKGIIEPALEPATDQLKSFVGRGAQAIKKQEALAGAILEAIEDVSGVEGEADGVRYAREIGLHRLTLKPNARLRDDVIGLVYLASNPNDTSLIPDALLSDLHLQPAQRKPLARFLFQLRKRLYEIDEFRPVLDFRHQANVENALRIQIAQQVSIDRNTGIIAGAVKPTPEGSALRVDVIDRDWDPTLYFESLLVKFGRLPLRLLGQRQLKSDKPITLDEVYTDLDVEENPNWDQTRALTKPARDLPTEQEWETATRGEKERLSALQAVSFDDQPRIVLLGYPGSGKSAFVNFLALCLVKEWMQPNVPEGVARLQGWTQGTRLPVRVVLREFVAWADTIKPTHNGTGTLWDYIAFEMKQHGFEDDFEYLKTHVQKRGGLILFDGLDEVREADQRREFIKQVIENFADDNRRSRFIVTCRPYAYENEDWQLARFRRYTLATFNPDQIENFIRGWYQIVGIREDWDEERVSKEINDLTVQAQRSDLLEFAKKPLLLTMMARLHAIDGHLPEDRAKLYERTVNLLLDEWQSEKGGGLSAFGLGLNDVAQVMSRVAFAAHKRQGEHADRRREAVANISGQEIKREFQAKMRLDETRAQEIIDYIQTRAGLLDPQDNHTYTFPHRTFQEYLAARDLLRDNEDDIAELTRGDREWWREVFLFTALSASLKEAVGLIEALCYSDVPATPLQSENAYASLIAAEAAGEIKLQENASTSRFQHILTRLRNWLVAIMQYDLLSLKEREEAGWILSKLGDPRPDIACTIPETLPVAAGEFVMGSTEDDVIKLVPRFGENWKEWGARELPQHRVRLNAYRIGKYPVTNAQFRHFVEDDGYTEKWRTCWTSEGWEWREKSGIVQPGYWNDPDENIANHPVNGVSWYEAVAYCNWLTRTDPQGRVYRLPTEAEWEKAARGEDGREYPWEGDFDPAKANISESGIGRTSAAGLFPRGASPCGALDMSGNVWEWCADWYGADYYKESPAENPQGPASGEYRVLRGGSFGSRAVYARCAYRLRYLPVYRNLDIGFRVAQSVLP